eukprot:scaffold316750_cov50-Attheya_sp.AAC.1
MQECKALCRRVAGLRLLVGVGGCGVKSIIDIYIIINDKKRLKGKEKKEDTDGTVSKVWKCAGGSI